RPSATATCRIWVSRRRSRSTRSELCAVRSAPAAGALPPMRSLPLKMPNKPNGRSVSCAQARHRTGSAAVIAAKMSADAVVTRSAKRAMAILLGWNPGIPYESLRQNDDLRRVNKFNNAPTALRRLQLDRLFGRRARRREALVPLAPFLEPLHHREERRHEQHRQAGRCDHPGEHRDADRHARAGA